MSLPVGIQWVAKSANATGTTSLSIALPSGVQDGDLLVMFLSHRGASYATMPSGWTVVPFGQQVTGGGLRGEVHWKRASSETGPYSVTGLANSSSGYIIAVRGALAIGNPINTSAALVQTSFQVIAPAITTTVPNTLVLMAGMKGSGSFSGPTFSVGSPLIEQFWKSDPDLEGMTGLGSINNTTGDDSCLTVGADIKIVEGSTINPFYITDLGIVEKIGIVLAIAPETGGATSGTRYYPTYGIPGTRLRQPESLHGAWDDCFLDSAPATRTIDALILTQHKSNGVNIGRVAGASLEYPFLGTNQQGNFDALWFRFMTPPLAAQTLAGTFDLTMAMRARWLDFNLGPTNASTVQLKLHVYISVGQTGEVRQTLIDNYLDATNIHNSSNAIPWRNLTTPQSLAGGVLHDGDSIVIEYGFRVVSSPTPTPAYPPNEYTRITVAGMGTWVSVPGVPQLPGVKDAIASTNASESSNDECAHFDFTDTLVELPLPASPTHISPMTAREIASVPYSEPAYDTQGSTANARAVWYRYTAARDGILIARAVASTRFVVPDVYSGDGSSYAGLVRVTPKSANGGDRSNGISRAGVAFEVTAGTTYFLRFYSGSRSWGGVLSVAVSYQETPQNGDLYLPCTQLASWRNGVCVNWTDGWWSSFVPSGITIDYTRRPMSDNNGGEHEGYRLFIALFSGDQVVILDLPTLNSEEFEIDTMFDVFELASGRQTVNPAALHMTKSGGFLYLQTYGNGFLRTLGIGLSGIPNSDLSSFAEHPDLGAVRGVDGTHADNQPGAPFPFASELMAAPEQSSPWHGGLNQETGILYYGSAGLYDTLPYPLPTTPGNGRVVKRFNVFSDVQDADFTTTPVTGGVSQSAKGACVLPTGDVIVANGDRLVRYTSAGALVQTYLPISDYPLNMVYAEPDPDGIHFWALDNSNAILFQFNIETGVQTQYVPTWMGVGNAIQFAIFNTEPIPVPIPSVETEIRMIRRLRRGPHFSDEFKNIRFTRFWLDVMAGVGTKEGLGRDPIIYLSWSDDGGHTWSDEIATTVGQLGNYTKRAQWRKLGSSRDRIFQVTMSDPVDWVLLAAYLELLPGTT